MVVWPFQCQQGDAVLVSIAAPLALDCVFTAALKAMREAHLACEQDSHALETPGEHPSFEGHHLRVVQKLLARMRVQRCHDARHGEYHPRAQRGWIPSQEVEVVQRLTRRASTHRSS